MTLLDWGIVAFTLALAIWGYRQGLIVGALTLIGFGLGAFAGSRLGPLVLAGGAESPYAPLVAALGALLVGATTAVALEGMALGLRARLIGDRPGRQLIDGVGGAGLIAAVGLGLTWVFGAVALHAPGATQLRADVQRSLILRSLNDVLPPSGPILNALNRVDPAPSIIGPTPPLARPNAAIARDPDVVRAGRSVLRVLGTACGLGVEGSGWVVSPGFAVTNAHVVAGEDDTTVVTQDGASFDAFAVLYEPRNDLALLRFNSNLAALPLAPQPRRGIGGAVLGYPENGPFMATPARLGSTSVVISENSYGEGRIHRSLTSLRGSVRSGNSGGPIVDSQGRVMATVFAATTSGPAGGFAIPNSVVEAALQKVTGPVDTGPCTG
jgi:trypsin-like peptidase/colicin V production protein